MRVPVRVRVCIGLRICLEDGGVSWSIDCLGLMLIWLRFRRTWPLEVSSGMTLECQQLREFFLLWLVDLW